MLFEIVTKIKSEQPKFWERVKYYRYYALLPGANSYPVEDFKVFISELDNVIRQYLPDHADYQPLHSKHVESTFSFIHSRMGFMAMDEAKEEYKNEC